MITLALNVPTNHLRVTLGSGRVICVPTADLVAVSQDSYVTLLDEDGLVVCSDVYTNYNIAQGDASLTRQYIEDNFFRRGALLGNTTFVNGSTIDFTGVTVTNFPSSIPDPFSGAIAQAPGKTAQLNTTTFRNGSTVDFTGTTRTALTIPVTDVTGPGALQSNITLAPSQLTPGSVPSGVTLPAPQLTAGSIPSGVTLAAPQLTAGSIPSGVTLPPGQLESGPVSSGVTVPAAQISSGNLASDVALRGRVNNTFDAVPSTGNVVGGLSVRGTSASVELVTTDITAQPFINLGRVTPGEGQVTVCTTTGEYNFVSGTGKPLGTLAGDMGVVASSQLLLSSGGGSSSAAAIMLNGTSGTMQIKTTGPLYGCLAPKLAPNFFSYWATDTLDSDANRTFTAADLLNCHYHVIGFSSPRTWTLPSAASLDIPAVALGCAARAGDSFESLIQNDAGYALFIQQSSDVTFTGTALYSSGLFFLPALCTARLQFIRTANTPTWNVRLVSLKSTYEDQAMDFKYSVTFDAVTPSSQSTMTARTMYVTRTPGARYTRISVTIPGVESILWNAANATAFLFLTTNNETNWAPFASSWLAPAAFNGVTQPSQGYIFMHNDTGGGGGGKGGANAHSEFTTLTNILAAGSVDYRFTASGNCGGGISGTEIAIGYSLFSGVTYHGIYTLHWLCAN
jgi:hypothetical protein